MRKICIKILPKPSARFKNYFLKSTPPWPFTEPVAVRTTEPVCVYYKLFVVLGIYRFING
jgi:hypothetical protein